MKKKFLIALSAISLVSVVAQADYQCTDFNNDVSMAINEGHITQFGDTSVLLESSEEKKFLFGTMHSEGAILLKKKVVELHPFQGDTLTILSKPKSCGRGSCDPGATQVITAQLKTGENQSRFLCHETNP